MGRAMGGAGEEGGPASRAPFPEDPGIRGPLHPRRLRCTPSPYRCGYASVVRLAGRGASALSVHGLFRNGTRDAGRSFPGGRSSADSRGHREAGDGARTAPLPASPSDPLRKLLRRRRQLEAVLVLLPFDDPGKGIEAHRPFFLVADKIPDLFPVLPDESATEGNQARGEPVGDLAARRTSPSDGRCALLAGKQGVLPLVQVPALVPADRAALRADAQGGGRLLGEIRVGFPGYVLFMGGAVREPCHRLPSSRVDITVGREDLSPL